MRIAALLTPTPDWAAIADAARTADDLGLDAIGFWDHYHSGQPDWAYVAGWSALGAVAAITERIKLLPMVVNNLHYEPGVLAKESSVLSVLSGGRLELGIGAGDWPASFAAWGRPFPPVEERLDRLVETIEAIRLAWKGEPVDFDGRYVQLRGAISTPAPAVPPRVVVGRWRIQAGAASGPGGRGRGQPLRDPGSRGGGARGDRRERSDGWAVGLPLMGDKWPTSPSRSSPPGRPGEWTGSA